jgi:hypothetical protein
MHHPDVCPPKSSFLRFQRGRHLVEETEAHVLIGLLLLLLLLLLSGGSLSGTTGSGGGGSGTSTTGGDGGELSGTLSDQL